MSDYIKTDGGENVLELKLNILVFQEDNFFLAYCPSLNLSSYGDSIQDAKDAFDEIMQSYIQDTQSRGTLTKDLVSLGWRLEIINHRAEPPSELQLEIPAGMLRKQYNESWPVALC